MRFALNPKSHKRIYPLRMNKKNFQKHAVEHCNSILYYNLILKYDGRWWWHTQRVKLSKCQPIPLQNYVN